MELNAIQKSLLKEVAELDALPVGACNIRSNGQSAARNTTEEIDKQDYILTPGRYVGIEEQENDGEPFEEKMARLTLELSEMFEKSIELQETIKKKLAAIGFEM